MSRIRLAAAAAGVVVAGLIAVFAISPGANDVAARTPLIGEPAPALSGAAPLGGGPPVKLAALRGKFVLLDFFASWCPPCQAEQPQLDAFASQHEATGDAEVVGIVYDDNTSSALRFVRRDRVPYPTVADPGGQIALHYGVRDQPTSFLISPDGTILTKIDSQVTARSLDQLVALAKAKGY
ncbi:MAG: TlpA family protein disulfide reductase [Acidimicrobiales bacterium]